MCISALHFGASCNRLNPAMIVRFAERELDRMETDKAYSGRHAVAIVHAYRRTLAIIRAADSERVFYGLAGLHFEKLKRRPGQYSMRLNLQWRLIVEFEGRNPKTVVIMAIEDYH